MSALVALSLAASLASMLERRRRRDGGLGLETLVLVTTTWLVLVGLLATALALLGAFGPVTMSVASWLSAASAWPWGRPLPTFSARPRWPTALGLLLVLGGMLLRHPTADYPLAGRDQGTYTLRAQHTLRTGRLDATDATLAEIEGARSRPGPADLRGLYTRRSEPWRRDRYEAAYRPGFYLADVESGHVRPQFFHLHPMLMATAGLVVGPANVAAVVPLWSALAMLGLWAVARRLWPEGPWAWLALALWVSTPLAIWVQRTALSEGPATVLVLGGLLAVLRTRTHGVGELHTAAYLLGALAWVRGNGWLAAPLLLAAQWLVPRSEPAARGSGLRYAAMFGAAVLVHAPTTYPYLHDELLRQLPIDAHLTPTMIIAATTAGLAGWFAADEQGPLRRHEATWLPRLHRWGPPVLVGLLLVAIAGYVALRVEPLARPFSRLDAALPLLGAVALGLAALGLGRTLRQWPRTPSATGAWRLGLAAMLVATVGLYAQRNLPQLGLYYYGRYLVPELLPATLLLAVEGLRGIHAWVRGRGAGRVRVTAAAVTSGLGALGLAWSLAGVLVMHPVTRLAEFAGADRVVDHLAAALPPDAVVIAGGEGWHSGHTFNQVAGALAFRHGIAVLPYRSREAAYASLHEMLVGRPEASGDPAPPVYLLLNEATKDHTRDPDSPHSRVRIAALDDLLPPPFVTRRIELVEMFLDRLTPTSEGPPVRVTRDGLRMALLHVEVDPQREQEVEGWSLEAEDGQWRTRGRQELVVSGGAPTSDQPCLGREPVVLTMPSDGGAGTGPVSLVLVATPGTAASNGQWTVQVDGEMLALEAPRTTPLRRDTLGPFALQQRPREVTITGAPKKTKRARCPYGGLAQVRLLGPDAPMLGAAETHAITFAPARALGHPVSPVAWVSGRGLSRQRPGLSPEPEIEGLSIVVAGGPPLRFPAAALPDGGEHPVDLVLTLTGSSTSPGARLSVVVDGVALPPVDPPDRRDRSWQSPALRWVPTSPTASITVQLLHAGPEDRVRLRDIGLFSRAPPVPGRLAGAQDGILRP